MPRFAILLTVCSFFFLFGCDEPPEKPTLELCVIDIDSNSCVCGVKVPNKPVGVLVYRPLAYCDKATAFIPEQWEKYKNYVDGLEAFIERSRRKVNK